MEIYIIAVEGIIVCHSVTTEQVQKHRRHPSHTDLFLSARQIEAVGLLLQVFPCDELWRQVHGVTLHQSVALDGSQHGIDPTELARPLVFHGGGLDQAFRPWLLQYLLHLLFAVAGCQHSQYDVYDGGAEVRWHGGTRYVLDVLHLSTNLLPLSSFLLPRTMLPGSS